MTTPLSTAVVRQVSLVDSAGRDQTLVIEMTQAGLALRAPNSRRRVAIGWAELLDVISMPPDAPAKYRRASDMLYDAQGDADVPPPPPSTDADESTLFDL